MPHALDEIRKFGRMGHAVYASDTFRTAPGNASRYVQKRYLTASPTFDTLGFIDDIASIVRTQRIDLVVPAFEEVFRIAKHMDRFDGAHVFVSPFETLARLHAKHRFVELCRELDLPVPETRVVTGPEALREATDSFDEYLARPGFTRGGLGILTNVGPLAGKLRREECVPTAERPWVVQRFVHGHDVCSFSVAHHGKLVAHSAYIHPKMIDHAGGIYFESVDEPESLAYAERIVRALNYHGQISFDFIKSSKGLVLVECNPRPTNGVLMMEPEEFVRAVFNPSSGAPHVVRPGVRLQIATAIIRDMLRDRHAIRSDLKALFSGARDTYAQRGDLIPGIYQALSYSHVLAFRHRLQARKRGKSDLVAAQFFDIAWDGGEIP
jgi:hypothetical protein